MGHGKSITVYLMDGDANQRYQVTLDNWNIVAFKIPYEMVSQSSNLNDLSLHTAGIYFLFGYQGSKNFVYVGEAEDVYRRLTQHTPEKDKFIWDTAVVFIATGYGVLDKAKIKYLENRLYSIIKSENSYILWNKNKPTKSKISKPSEDSMESAIDKIKLVIPVLGYTPFNKRKYRSRKLVEKTVSSPEVDDKKIFYINQNGVEAKCILDSNGKFVLLSGSQISLNIGTSFKKKLRKKRTEMTKKGDIVNNIIQRDTYFDSATAIASFVVGYSINGKTNLKTEDGQTLAKYLESISIN
ncbi:GIY-YIG nuclease family protein [Ligilactobacillus salivarius]|uniref:GIY-YIG nuclease family protein n=1 Tax=Ligilactobacillus salivarius TaxID=1624 RepID=UPI0009DAF928|nr:GIY-YIG nuclease family protein [Ligilactobacillus salivarius]ATP35737.1 hypothetical protein CR249_05685 [Ligilactobacillus salivarius]MDO5005252.1 GIY-YIG nuclease family protein [Ligilactobacillus salivarius]OQR01627.1 hypothetical protein B6U48_06320 [Ligilactobacillus salivarius]OQR03810.1 hypothetical protein B6U49_06310 [Ligilactobacillus salivarius]